MTYTVNQLINKGYLMDGTLQHKFVDRVENYFPLCLRTFASR